MTDSANTFVVRIYRRSTNAAPQLAGTVESVDDGGVHSFSSFQELRAVLERCVTKDVSTRGRPRRFTTSRGKEREKP